MNFEKRCFLMPALLCALSCFWANVFGQESVKIGKQEWATRNLEVSTFRNGDVIPLVKTDAEWMNATREKKPAWCYYNNDSQNGEKFGKLYNWYAVSDLRGLAPSGWHVPTDKEWTVLIDFLGGENVAGKKMKSKKGWQKGKASNESGFTALPGEGRSTYGPFGEQDDEGFWWSATDDGYTTGACGLFLSSNEKAERLPSSYKGAGYSVRCIKN